MWKNYVEWNIHNQKLDYATEDPGSQECATPSAIYLGSQNWFPKPAEGGMKRRSVSYF